MIDSKNDFPSYTIFLSKADLRPMITLVKLLYTLSKQSQYRQSLTAKLPITAQFNPHHDSVLMGYDFHLSDMGPQLIEVNNNAGGLWLAWQAHYPGSLGFAGKLAARLIEMFLTEFRLWAGELPVALKNVVILDEAPESQYLFPEMQAFEALFKQHGINAFIVAPEQLTLTDSGLYFQGVRIDLIYNRHCNFYLDTSTMAPIRAAYLAKQVCLTPSPFAYGLLADKRRMIDWSTPNHPGLGGLDESQQDFLLRMIPQTRLLATYNPEQLWQQRKQWVFKPATAYASRGVYLGKKLTTSKFSEFNPEETLVQRMIEPSIFEAPNQQQYKVDIRLFVYRDQILTVAARIYQGQVTNLRTEGGGFVRVKLI